MTEGVSLANEVGTIVYTNPAEDKMFGYAAGELVGQHVSVQNAYSEEENQRIVSSVIERLKREGSWEGEWRNRRKDGSEFITASRISAVEIDGRTHWLCVQRDITAEREISDQLRASELRLRLAVEAGQIGEWELDVATDKSTRALRHDEIFGYDGPVHDWGFERFIGHVVQEDRPAVEAAFRQAAETGTGWNFECRIRRARDGELRWIRAHSKPQLGRSGNVERLFGLVQDITETKSAEAALRASEERFRRIFEQTSDLILTADLNQVITDCNPAAAEAVGLTRSEAVGCKISDFISPEDYERTTQMLMQKLHQGGTTRYDVRVRSSSGEWLLWEINSGLTFDEAGTPVGLHVVGRDVTERKRLETYQRLLVGELNHRVKNTLSVVQSLAHQTFREDVPPREAIRGFEGRLEALAAAHNLLTRESWASASIREVLGEVLVPFCSDGRCHSEGPELRLPPKLAVGLALATHELATNAAKYGALSDDGGQVWISWSIREGVLDFLWREEGGPPVAPPSRQGFGTRMIKRSLAAEFGGEVELSFDPQGVRCRVVAPVPLLHEGSPRDNP